MRLVYVDCASGVSGDMLLGALIDAGLPLPRLRSLLAPLRLRGYRLTARRVKRASIGAVKLDVTAAARQPARGWKEIRSMVRRGRLDPRVREAALDVFLRLVRVEARLHRIPVEKVHLHELGGIDSIVDIVGAVAGLHETASILDGGKLICSPLNVGSGTIQAEHGILPVPAPATAALLRGIPVYAAGAPGEKVTPTGAALMRALASSFGPPPPMIIEAIGHGAGARDDADQPNVVRLLIGKTWDEQTGRGGSEVVVLECTIDDMNPQGYGYLMERLFELDALEVFYTPVQMKKDRPGVLVTVIAPPRRRDALARILFTETTTLGLRYRSAGRIELARRMEPVSTRFGRIRVKVASLDGRVVQAQPEYDDCRRIAARRRVPLKDVQAAAAAAWRERS